MTQRGWIAVALLVIALGAVHVAHLPLSGLDALNYDAFRYLAGAESILRTGKYIDLDGRPQQVWPPGLSLLYAGVSRLTGRAPETLIRPIDFVAYLVTALSFAAMLFAARIRGSLAVLALATFVLNGAVLSAHDKMWSDPVAIALLSFALFALVRQRPAWFVAACGAIALAISVRYAMIAAVPLLVVAGWRIRRPLALVPLLTPLPMLAMLAVVGAGTGSRGNRSLDVSPIPWRENAEAFLELANQVVPRALLGSWLTALALLVIALAPAFVLRRNALAFVAFGWTACYLVFLHVAQPFSYPSFAMDLRIFLPFLPSLSAGLAAAADAMPRRVLIAVAIPLALAAARSTRFAVTHLDRPSQPQSCVARRVYVDAIRRANPPGTILTNAQGLVWYAVRRPVLPLTQEHALRAPLSAFIVIVDPARICQPTTEYTDVTIMPSPDPDPLGLTIHSAASPTVPRIVLP